MSKSAQRLGQAKVLLLEMWVEEGGIIKQLHLELFQFALWSIIYNASVTMFSFVPQPLQAAWKIFQCFCWLYNNSTSRFMWLICLGPIYGTITGILYKFRVLTDKTISCHIYCQPVAFLFTFRFVDKLCVQQCL